MGIRGLVWWLVVPFKWKVSAANTEKLQLNFIKEYEK